MDPFDPRRPTARTVEQFEELRAATARYYAALAAVEAEYRKLKEAAEKLEK